MKHLWSVALVIALAGCSNEISNSIKDKEAVDSIASLASKGLPSGAKILAKCGASKGYVIFQTPDGKILSKEDRITDGFIAVVQLANGSIDILSRDATMQFTSPADYGGSVTQTSVGQGKRTFVVLMPRGVVQSYQLVDAPKTNSIGVAQSHLFWSQSKAGSELGFPGAQSFVTDCY